MTTAVDLENEIARMERRAAELVQLRDPLTRELLTLRSQIRQQKEQLKRAAAAPDLPRANRSWPRQRRDARPIERPLLTSLDDP